MKSNIYILLLICFLITNCKNKSTKTDNTSSTSQKIVLNLETDSYKLMIKEVDKNKYTNFKNSYHSKPFLGIKAECLSLKELIRITKNTELNSIILESKNLENKYYNIIVEQTTTSKEQDSIIKNNITKSLNLNIEMKTFNIDTINVSVENRKKFLKYANNTLSDSITSKQEISQDHIKFENYNLENILISLNKEYDKTLFLSDKEPQRINIKLKRNNWRLIKENLQSELGLAFNTKTHQEVKYIIRANNLAEKN